MITGRISLNVDSPLALLNNESSKDVIRAGIANSFADVSMSDVEILSIGLAATRRLAEVRHLSGIVSVRFRITPPTPASLDVDMVNEASASMLSSINTELRDAGVDVTVLGVQISDVEHSLEEENSVDDDARTFAMPSTFLLALLVQVTYCMCCLRF